MGCFLDDLRAFGINPAHWTVCSPLPQAESRDFGKNHKKHIICDVVSRRDNGAMNKEETQRTPEGQKRRHLVDGRRPKDGACAS